MGINRTEVKLVEHSNDWHEEFVKEKENLIKLIGEYVNETEHVGSTAIPGLKAKPVIDIAISIDNLQDALKFSKILEDNGYEFRYDNGEKGEYFVSKGEDSNKTHFIHIVENNSERWDNLILFRDYLLKHPNLIKEYQTLKEELFEKYKDNRKMYTSSKNDFIQEVIKRAKEESI